MSGAIHHPTHPGIARMDDRDGLCETLGTPQIRKRILHGPKFCNPPGELLRIFQRHRIWEASNNLLPSLAGFLRRRIVRGQHDAHTGIALMQFRQRISDGPCFLWDES